MNALQDYRTFIRDILNHKVQLNPRYSMRAFARDLGISASILSEVMNGKHGLSEKMATKIAAKLGINNEEKLIFCDQVASIHSRSATKRDLASKRIEQVKRMYAGSSLQMDTFKIISDWYHFAILEITYLEDFNSEHTWMAKKLGMSKLEVDAAVERLIRVGLLQNKNGKLRATEDYTSTPNDIPSEVIKKFQRQLIEKSLTALTMQSIESRDITSLTLSIDKNKLPTAKKKLREFRREFNAEFGHGKKKNSVYCLALQFFELTI
jgi:uncharacterized protein (TIGR02147 family)